MRSGLWLKLMGILAVIVVAGAVVTFVLIERATNDQFHRLVLNTDIVQAQNLSVLLSDYYRREGSWQGVETLLQANSVMQPQMMMGPMQGMMRSGAMAERMQQDEQMRQMMTALADRVVLLDATGEVVADTAGRDTARKLDTARLTDGIPVLLGEEPVGMVLVGSMVAPALNPLDVDFLQAVNGAVLWSAVTVGLLALALGSFFFFHITAPVRELTQAAEALAAGDSARQVAIRSHDEIGRLGHAFNDMAASLRHSEDLRRQMVADIAHELRTPLSLIQGTLEAILDGVYDLNMENIGSLHEETMILTRLVGDLRELALAEAGRLDLELTQVAAAELIEQAVDGFQTLAQEAQISLTTEIDPDLPLMQGDQQRLNQVLANLISNALRYTPAGGQVTVSAVLLANAPPQANAGEAGPWLRITVSDTGEGVEAADLPYVFERFYRADKSRTRFSGGTGLGLAIARQIISAHNGYIWVESAGPGRGSDFILALPAVTGE